jgi:uncharacterized protein YjbI with pentapeptide repeats
VIARIRQYLLTARYGAVVLVLMAFFVGAIVGSSFAYLQTRVSPDWAVWWSELLQSLGAEIFGASLLFFLMEMIAGRRRAQEAKARKVEDRKEWLIWHLGSIVNEETMRVAEELRTAGWLQDGSLEGARLWRANLQEVRLWRANLKKASLREANLQGTDLIEADLRGADLVKANLQGASLLGTKLEGVTLWEANLQGASLWGANMRLASLWHANLQETRLWQTNLQGASLEWANLRGANLREANLIEASFSEAIFDETTVLPDRTAWTPNVNLARFTNPEHPKFWRSDNPESPAYWEQR